MLVLIGATSACRPHPRGHLEWDETTFSTMESDRDQAHLPAEQPSTREDPWLPAADAYPCRSRHHLGPPPQGPRRTVGLSRQPVARNLAKMLPREHRLRRSTEFAAVLRSGARARRGQLLVHQQRVLSDGPATVGLVVGKSVGGSVVRHRVSRRLRAQLALRLDALPNGSGTVVRALPGAARATSAELGVDLHAALRRLARPQ